MDPTKFNCIFCKDSFEDKEQLQIHFRKHGDPKFNQNAKNTKKSSASESQHSNEKNDVEVVSCDVCADVFTTISKAITHKHKMHPDHDVKYFCPWCGKLFTMKHLYNKHIESTHSLTEENPVANTGFHCDYCDVDFFAAPAMIYHNKFFHRQDTELAAIGYSKKMKLSDQEVLPIYYCPFCGEEYFNKVNLHKHMGDDHSDENQSPDDVLRCPLCEAIFYHLDAYELHLIFHASDDLYNDENDLVKGITEFSLEAVPPIMEKVENESQEDEEANISSMGIENFLQQAMNETNDNDASNGEVLPHKKKKHKKHKKSKKPTITLDEFLSMNTEVFGEGQDVQVQGIMEVPSQVVAKQLRKPQNMKKRPTAMQSQEIEKLRKQGIIIKKKPGSLPQGNKMNEGPNKNSVPQTSNLPSVSKPRPTPLSTTNDVLNKLLNQSNSQIKIVKKSSQNNDVDKHMAQGSPDISNSKPENNKLIESNSEEQIQDTQNPNSETTQLTDIGIPISKEMNTGQIDWSKAIPLRWKDDPPYDCRDTKSDRSSQPRENGTTGDEKNASAASMLKTIEQQVTVKPIVTSRNSVSEQQSILEGEQRNSSCGEIYKSEEDKNKIMTVKQSNDTKTLNVLKHLSNLTVKSVNQIDTESPEPSKDVTKVFKGVSLTSKVDTGDNPADEKRETICPTSTSLEALKNISKHITVKASKKTAQIIESTDETTDSDRQYTSEQEFDTTAKEGNKNATINETVTSTTNASPQNKPQMHSLDALKNIMKHITVKAPKNTQIIDDTGKVWDSKNKDLAQDEFDTEVENNTKRAHQKNPINTSLQKKLELNALDPLRNISKHITIKAPKKTEIFDHMDEEMDSENENINDDDGFDSEDIKGDSDEPEKEIQRPKISTKVKLQSKPEMNSHALQNVSKQITVKRQKISSHINQNSSEDMDSNDEDVAPTDVIENSIPMRPNQSPKTNPNVKSEPKSLNALKNISKQITIKSLNKPTVGNVESDDGEPEDEFDENIKEKDNTNVPGKSPTALKAVQNFKSPEIRKAINSPTKDRHTSLEEGRKLGGQIVKKQVPSDIMKQFPNITAKSVNITKSHKQQITSASQSVHIVKGNFMQKCVKTEQKNETIETFNIDDSEDEEPQPNVNKAVSKPVTVSPKNSDKSGTTLNAIKKLSSNITIKPSNKLQDTNRSPVPEEMPGDESDFDDPDDAVSSPDPAHEKNTMLQKTLKCLGQSISIKPSSPQAVAKSKISNQHSPNDKSSMAVSKNDSKCNSKPIPRQNIALQNTLRNISQHISIKSNKTANFTESYNRACQDDSDSDTHTNVKITELENECSSDDEAISTNQTRNKSTANNVIVQTPSEPNSDNEDYPSNTEDQIKRPSTSFADNQLVKYKNLNLKSLQDFSFDEEDESGQEEGPDLANTNIKVSNKPIRRSNADSNIANSRSMHQMRSSGQVNTVNKEVSMQRFQTETVIQEITTTVTKTIRTVNQSVKQEVRGTTMNPPTHQIRQKVQGIPENMSKIDNLRGVQVRQLRPAIGVKVRNSMAPTRPAVAPVRLPNQMVPTRPSAPRPNNPRPVAKKNQQASPNVSKQPSIPVKFAQNAQKRPSQEPSGHFSCFKKPKESLIPVSDVPAMSSHLKESTAHFKETVQMSSKTATGDSVVTKSRTKTETSSEQLNKLSNMSGLKIVKTSQKQATQTEESTEVSAPKRKALEAIERLQRQGLLVKKPREDDHELNDDDCGYSGDDDCYDSET